MHNYRNTKITKNNTGDGYILSHLCSTLKKWEVNSLAAEQRCRDCFFMIAETIVETSIYAIKKVFTL